MAERELSLREQLTLEKIKQETARAAAQTEAALAEAEDFRANAMKSLVEAEQTKILTRMDQLSLEETEQKRKEELAGNKYHHKYNFTSAVDSNSSQALMNQLTLWSRQDPGCDIEIVFSSPGGSVIDGMALFDFIQSLRTLGHKITTGAIGYAASMAGILLQAGDVRWLGRESYILIHEVSFGCVTADAKVLTKELKWVPAGQLKSGDKILAFDEFKDTPGKGTYRAWREAEILEAVETHAALYQVKFTDGTSLTVSEGHPWLSRTGTTSRWMRTRNLNKNCNVNSKSHVMKLLPVVEQDMAYDSGYIAGLMDGEGSLQIQTGTACRLSFAQNEGKILDHFVKWCSDNDFETRINIDRKARHVTINGGIKETYRFLSLVRPKRLLEKFGKGLPGFQIKGVNGPDTWLGVESIECVGEGPVIRLETSTHTFVGDGFAMHNAGGKIGEVEDEVKFVKKIQERVLTIFESRCQGAGKNGTATKPLTKNQLKDKWARRDWWISSDEGLEWGLVDEVK